MFATNPAASIKDAPARLRWLMRMYADRSGSCRTRRLPRIHLAFVMVPLRGGRTMKPQMHAESPGAADRPQPNQSKDRAGVSGRRYRAGSANSKGNRKQRKKRKSRACMARAPDLRRCRCNLRLRFLRYLRFPFLASMRYPTRHDPCGKRFRRNSALRAVHRKITAGCGDLPG